jgi:hypothetical protein
LPRAIIEKYEADSNRHAIGKTVLLAFRMKPESKFEFGPSIEAAAIVSAIAGAARLRFLEGPAKEYP